VKTGQFIVDGVEARDIIHYRELLETSKSKTKSLDTKNEQDDKKLFETGTFSRLCAIFISLYLVFCIVIHLYEKYLDV
jgi:hypothetical protein